MNGVPPLVLYAALLFMGVVCVYDFRERRIPNYLNLAGLLTGLLLQVAVGGVQGFLSGLSGFAVGFAILLLPFVVGMVGGGDVKFVAAAGTFLGWQLVLLGLGIGALVVGGVGLLLLTNDGRVIHRLTDPRFGHPRTYLVQLEGIPDERALDALRRGVMLKGLVTKPAQVALLTTEPSVPPRPVPIRSRKTVPTSWVEITLTEGRNRQVRHMTAAIGHPTLRLIRTAIGPLSLEGLAPGDHRVLSTAETSALLESLRLSGPDRPRLPRPGQKRK